MRIIDTGDKILTGDNHPQLKIGDKLYEKYVPDFFKSFMNKQKLEEIAQSIYDDMKLFTENDLKDSVYKEEL